MVVTPKRDEEFGDLPCKNLMDNSGLSKADLMNRTDRLMTPETLGMQQITETKGGPKELFPKFSPRDSHGGDDNLRYKNRKAAQMKNRRKKDPMNIYEDDGRSTISQNVSQIGGGGKLDRASVLASQKDGDSPC